MNWIAMVASAIAAYILGSIPTGYLIGRVHRIDIRRFGSGRTGGTNVLRTLGWLPALLTAAGDILKGAGAVWAAQAIQGTVEASALAAVFAVLGHNFTFTLRFKGGAGVATMVGATAVLSFPVAALLAPLGVVVMAV